MGTNYDFIELYNMAGNRFFGGFSCLEAAKPHLDKLREKGELPAKPCIAHVRIQA